MNYKPYLTADFTPKPSIPVNGDKFLPAGSVTMGKPTYHFISPAGYWQVSYELTVKAR